MEVLERADVRLRSDEPDATIWPTGFGLLDDAIGGGLRAGSLTLLAGPQGQGKSTFALQIARNAVVAGRSAVYFSFELEAEALLQKLVAMEAGSMDPLEAPTAEPDPRGLRGQRRCVRWSRPGRPDAVAAQRGPGAAAGPLLRRPPGRLPRHRDPHHARRDRRRDQGGHRRDRRGPPRRRRLPPEGLRARGQRRERDDHPDHRAPQGPLDRVRLPRGRGRGRGQGGPRARAAGCARGTCAAPPPWPTSPTWC